MSDHPLDAFECKADGKCELHRMAREVGLERVRYNHGARTHLDLPVDDSNPYFAFDPTRCILCSRCVRACDDIQGTFALTIDGRGFNSLMSPGQHQHYIDSECVSCGACVQACPTDALMEKTVLEKGVGDRADRHHLRLLRGRMFLQGRGARRRNRAHGAEQERHAESRPLVREGPLRMGLRDASGSRPHADDSRAHPGSVARGFVGRGDRIRRARIQAGAGEVRARLGRRNHLVAMHQRRGLPGAEAGARGVRQQ